MMNRIMIVAAALLAAVNINAQYATKDRRAIRAYEEAANYYEFSKWSAALNSLEIAKRSDPKFT